jgi:hypothetical protein
MTLKMRKQLLKYGTGSAIVLSLMLLLFYGTLSPCGIAKKMMMSRMVETMGSDKQRNENPFSGLAMAVGINMVNNVFDSLSPPRCAYAALRIGFGADPGVMPASKQDQPTTGISEEKVKNDPDAKNILSKVEVLKSRFYVDHSNEFMAQPVISITVKNSTPTPLKRIYFVGTLASPKRAIPWVKESFNYEMPGGLEPGETGNWNLEPNALSEWKKGTEAPKDAVFTVEVVRIDGADGKPIADISE